MEVEKAVQSLMASIGKVDQRPTSGGFRLKLGEDPPVVGENVTNLMPHDVRASVLRTELKALSIVSALGDVTVTEREGSWQIVFAGLLNPIPMELQENSLIPLSFARSRHFEFNGEWMHELRFVQAPVAFTSSHNRVVPPAPSLTVVQHGGSDASAQWNEVQKLYVPPQFRGTYQIKRGFSRSALFSIEDGIDEITEGLQVLADEGGEFLVTSPQTGVAMIEFSGSMAGSNQDELTVEVIDAPIGDLTITLNLDTAELAAMLRTADEVKLPLEIEAVIQDDQDSLLFYRTTLIRQEVTIRRELNWQGLSSPQNIDWIRPPLPRNYIPWREDQVYFGEFHWSDSFGDGVLQEFVFDHNLESVLLHVTVAENGASGRVLVNGVDYTLQVENENSLHLLHLGDDPPPTDGLIIIISSAGTRGAFQAHTHTVAQIIGLQTILENFGSRIETLETLVPTGALTVATVDKEKPIAEWELPGYREVYPTYSDVEMKAALVDWDLSEVFSGGLLPAIHVTSTEALPLPLPDDPSEAQLGKVYENTGAVSVWLDGGGGRRSVELQPGEFATVLEHEDRVSWYRVAQQTENESSWYPTDFDRELFMLSVNEKQLRVGTRFELSFGIEAAIFKSMVFPR